MRHLNTQIIGRFVINSIQCIDMKLELVVQTYDDGRMNGQTELSYDKIIDVMTEAIICLRGGPKVCKNTPMCYTHAMSLTENEEVLLLH